MGGPHPPQCRGACGKVGLPQALTPGTPQKPLLPPLLSHFPRPCYFCRMMP